MEHNETIRWRDWGPEVFARSREEKKPIFLSISATWCHWCHVMDEEAFDYPEVIRRLNGDFIPVRVDSDKRPDINSRYNMGGWPTVAILDAEGGVYSGGTYMPTSHLLDLLSRVKEKAPGTPPENSPVPQGKSPASGKGPDPEGITEVLGWVDLSFDREYGGFGPPPKFPHPWILELILRNRERVEDPKWRHMALMTLDAMRESELYDREDGGFFRYATRGDWDRPHFEKLLETNSQMLSVYLEAYRVLNEPTYLATARGVLDYLKTFLAAPEHPGFFGSQSADGEYYSLSEDARLNSPPPPVDQTIYSGLNADSASALIQSGLVLGEPGLISSGLELADFLWEKFKTPESGMSHCAGGASPLQGYLADQVRMVTLLLKALELNGGPRFLDRALDLLDTMNRNLWDEDSGAYRDLPHGTSREGFLKKEMKPLADNSLAAMALTRLYYLTGDKSFFLRAEKTLAFLSCVFRPYKFHAAVFALALEHYLNPPDSIVIIGPREDENWRRLVQAAHRMDPSKTPYWKVVVPLDNKDDFGRIEKLGHRPSERPVAFFCRGRTCLPPVYNPGALESLPVSGNPK
ncbi:MAG TPA: DUF255 domain-containing protein [Nitrospiria bacterium]